MFCAGRILDQFEHVVLIDDFAGRDCNVLANHELFGSERRLAGNRPLAVLNQILQPREEVAPSLRSSDLQNLWVRQNKVRGRENIKNLASCERETALIAR